MGDFHMDRSELWDRRDGMEVTSESMRVFADRLNNGRSGPYREACYAAVDASYIDLLRSHGHGVCE
jgi:hypothetical protein